MYVFWVKETVDATPNDMHKYNNDQDKCFTDLQHTQLKKITRCVEFDIIWPIYVHLPFFDGNISK